MAIFKAEARFLSCRQRCSFSEARISDSAQRIFISMMVCTQQLFSDSAASSRASCVSLSVSSSSRRSRICRWSRLISPSFCGIAAQIWLKVSSCASSPIDCSEGTVSRLRSFRSRSSDSVAACVSLAACLREPSSLSASLRSRMASSLAFSSRSCSSRRADSSASFSCLSYLIWPFRISSSSLLLLRRAASWVRLFSLPASSCRSFSFSVLPASIWIKSYFTSLASLSSSAAYASFAVLASSFSFLEASFSRRLSSLICLSSSSSDSTLLRSSLFLVELPQATFSCSLLARVSCKIFYLSAMLSFSSFSFSLLDASNSLFSFRFSLQRSLAWPQRSLAWSSAVACFDCSTATFPSSSAISLSSTRILPSSCTLFLPSLVNQLSRQGAYISEDFFLTHSSMFLGSSRKKLLLSLCSSWLLEISSRSRKFSSCRRSRSSSTLPSCSLTAPTLSIAYSYSRWRSSSRSCSCCQLALLCWASLCSKPAMRCSRALFFSSACSQRQRILAR